MALTTCIQRGRPLGHAGWLESIAARLSLTSTLRRRGRPRKDSQGEPT